MTIELATMYVEHAPPADAMLMPGVPTGWTLEDGHAICGLCAMRIIRRGCDFSGVSPIWDVPVACDLCSK
jgi:hypothetical protein